MTYDLYLKNKIYFIISFLSLSLSRSLSAVISFSLNSCDFFLRFFVPTLEKLETNLLYLQQQKKKKRKEEQVKAKRKSQVTRVCLYQGLPFHSTIVQRVFKHIAYALLFSRLLDVARWIRLRQAHMSADTVIFFMYTLKKYFIFKNPFFKFK